MYCRLSELDCTRLEYATKCRQNEDDVERLNRKADRDDVQQRNDKTLKEAANGPRGFVEVRGKATA